MGWALHRTSDAYATNDGAGRILIGVDEVLDANDALAQLVFHELCHALVQGPSSWSQPDWGLSNTDDRDVIAEHACLCVQVLLASSHGLRAAMAPTTEYRAYHDTLVEESVAVSMDEAAVRARVALAQAGNAPLLAIVNGALARTKATLAGDGAAPNVPERHPTGMPWGAKTESCGSCAWFYKGGRGPAVARCRQAASGDEEGHRTEASHRACERWERPVDCQTCGACCREAYHSVTVSVRDPVVWKQPELIVRHGHRFEIRREGSRCAALEDRRQAPPADEARAPLPLFSCSIYDDRPRPCRDFEAGGKHCLVARRRVGLSR
ncbi:MAG TPA: YkgJ family cysteine cluster protein [Polyangia bacterium]